MDRDDICSRFLDACPFDLYPFQEEALLAWFEAEAGVLVTAPTGMGKTLIAEAAVFEALHSRRRIYYTTPLIALTDQKFRDMQDRAETWGFSRDDVGLITGNRKENPDALVRVVVAEILLNHLLAGREHLGDTAAVVMDEFHSFNDYERGIVWELSLAFLPRAVRLMLLSATVGNPAAFLTWLHEQHGRRLRLVKSDERRVPLEFIWVGDKLLTEHLPDMISDQDAESRTPALVFCFNRDECWSVAERLKGVTLIDAAARSEIERQVRPDDFAAGIGPKLRQMLIRGVGVHHAGVLPKHKHAVERLFLQKLIPFVVCTETLAAGINLPARSVVLSTLLKGKPKEKKLVPASAAHQMFGRAGRPQFDAKGYVYAVAPEDDVKIHKWHLKYAQIDPKSKDPGIMRARKALERKRPKRRSTAQYWTEGQFHTLIKSGPAKLASRSMIPYQVLVYLFGRLESLSGVRSFLSKRFTTSDRIEGFQKQLDHMVANLERFGYLSRDEDRDHVTLHDTIEKLTHYRSVDPLYGAFLRDLLARGSAEEKMQALESLLPLSPAIRRKLHLPFDLPPGPLQTHVLEPELIQRGIVVSAPDGVVAVADEDDGEDYWRDTEQRPLQFPDMLKALFDARLVTPEALPVEPKWVAGALAEHNGDFYGFIRARDLAKNEGLILRHLLRLAILAGEFLAASQDPDYADIAALATRACHGVEPRYTEWFLSDAVERDPGVLRA
ncbi:MAG: DEAD/DEAH box helicase [Phycisphaerae bacterium]